MKTCMRCKEEKDLSLFGKSYFMEDFKNKLCKKCVNANQKRLRDIRAAKFQEAQVAKGLVVK